MERKHLNEEWQPVPGYEGLYEVSDLGRVRSLDRHQRYVDGRPRFYKGKVLKPIIDTNGYPFVGINRRRFYVHTLVLMAFVSSRPEGMDGCHNDGVPHHNWPDNLRWDTRSNNQRDRIKHGTFKPFGLAGEVHHLSVLNDRSVRRARLLYVSGRYTFKRLAIMFGCTRQSIASAVRRQTWKHVA